MDKVKEKMDNLRGLLGNRRTDGVPNARIRELYCLAKRVDERIHESVLRWFGHERMIGLLKGYE